MKKDRRSFLTQVCPTVAFAFFGLSFLEACSSDSGSGEPEGPDPGQGNTGDDGYSINGSTVTVDLSNSNFSSISTSGGFKNLLDAGVLLLRISSNEILAFDNCCPHVGTATQWSYANNKFTCGNHGNSFGIDNANVVNCNSGSTSGNLKSYSTSISGTTLTITTS
jgi:nitrite reductase/ring-hydroxylating ferredoxin subunit